MSGVFGEDAARAEEAGAAEEPAPAAQARPTEEEALGHYRRVRDEIRAFVEHLDERIGGLPHL